MPKVILSFVLLHCFALSFSQQKQRDISTKTKQELTQLIEQEKYASAWDWMKKNYSDSLPEHLIAKSDFCLRYFSQTKYHQNFNFNNLDSLHPLSYYRAQAPTAETTFDSFNPEKLLLAARAKHPNDYSIYLALGNYYYEVNITYRQEWIKPQNEVQALYYYYYNEAYLHQLKTSGSLFAMGVYLLNQEDTVKAKNLMYESLSLDSTFAPAHYNLAYLFAAEDSLNEALFHAQTAYDLYEEKALKSDAASICGILLLDHNKYADAINWLLISDALMPGNFHVYQSLLQAYLNLNKMQEADLIAKNLYYYDWKNANIFNKIQEAYLNNKKENELYAFLNERLKERIHDKEYQGFVYIYLTQLAIVLNDKKMAKSYLESATLCFTTCYDSEHSIFKALKHLEKTIGQ